MSDLDYTNAKLFDITYVLATHEGDARARLAYCIDKLLVVQATFSNKIPQDLKKEFEWVMDMVEKGRTKYRSNIGLKECTLPNIRNSTASKIIKKLIYIQNQIETMLE